MSGFSVFKIILSGFSYNLLFTLLASILPVAAGIGLSFAMKATKSRGGRTAIRLFGVFFYCLVPSRS